jgi:hypothetical protein
MQTCNIEQCDTVSADISHERSHSQHFGDQKKSHSRPSQTKILERWTKDEMWILIDFSMVLSPNQVLTR